MFENKLTHNGIHYSRYIASWKREGGKIYRGGLFEQWLREQEKLTDEEISDILLLASNGKMELESSARQFMKTHTEDLREERKLAAMSGYFEECTGTHIHWLEEVLDEELEKANIQR